MGEMVSRRRFGWMAGAVVAGAGAATGRITARQAIERIRKNVGVPWREPTVDTFKAGDPDTPVEGIATSFMATLDVLKRSAAAGKNLVISHEPTFYNHEDVTAKLTGDPVYRYKQEFIEKNHMVVWRFHDHWHARKPDAMLTGLAEALGLLKYRTDTEGRMYAAPAAALATMAEDFRKRLNARAMRVIGNPETSVRTIALNPGFTSLEGAIHSLREADVLVCGEPREWEGVEYAQDAMAAGEKKGLIMLGHALSEDPGMKLCAQWLKTFINEAPIEWIPAGEPFWRPA